MNVMVLDTETTSIEGAVCEIAGVEVDGERRTIHRWATALVDPKEQIAFGAMAIHHITQDMVDGERTLEEALSAYRMGSDDNSVYAAHNAKFDRSKLPEQEQSAKWICTMRCAQHLYPHLESFSNQAIRYQLGLDIKDMPNEAGNLPHRALFDAWVTARLLCFMLDGYTVDELVEYTLKPVLLQTCNFGKHRGTAWCDVPKDYLRWASNQDFDEDVAHTIRYYLS